MIGKILILIIVLGIIPFCIGLIPVNLIDEKMRSIGVTYISGFLLSLGIFQLITVPIVIVSPWGFKLIVPLFTSITGILAVAGIGITIFLQKKGKTNFAAIKREHREKTTEEKVMWLIVFLLIAFQMFMAFTRTSFDGDDAYYVVQSLLTQETDTLYRIRPYTGLSTGMDLRHSLAVFPIWIAYIGKISNIHSTIIAHSVLPLILIPITYWIYLEIGKKLFKRDRKKLPMFMIFICIMQIFGNVSIYTNATFFLTRTWQGKSLLANLVIPAVLWLLLWIFEKEGYEKENRIGLWLMLFNVNIVAALSSTASVFLIALLIGVNGIVLGIQEKTIQIPLRLMITCIPLVVYGAMFLLI
ncbi:MAG: DUF6077 domain-containing protein [Lachnospiraceae bacterium]|nr:DUF6077 domain-containing protein [Lachnospiraceae bacterium]